MGKIWVDIFNGPHVHFFKNIGLYEKDVVFTARDYKPIPELIKLYGIDCDIIGSHGGKSNLGKLLASSERVMELAKYVQNSDFKLLVHKHSVEAARVGWGAKIPSISYIDNELMVPQNMLVCPLTNVLIAPIAIEQYVLRNFTPSHVSILQFKGVSEVANVYNFIPNEKILKDLQLDTNKPIIVLRGEPLLASYNSNNGIADRIEISIKEKIKDAQIVRISREGESNCKLNGTFDARSLCCYADLVISGGGTITREAALLGAKAISYFEHPLAVDRYLIKHKILESFPGEQILDVDWSKKMKEKKHKFDINMFEHPFALLEKAKDLIEWK